MTLKKIMILLLTLVLLTVMGLHAKVKKGPGSYKILNNTKTPIRIPFKLHHGKPLMDVEINGKKATLMIDNGIMWEEVWLFGSPLVKKLKLKPVGDFKELGDTEPTEIYSSTNLTLKFKDIVFYEQPVLVSPTSAGFSKMFPGSDGQLCNTFFKHFMVEFDFIKSEVVLHKPEKFKFAGEGSVLNMKENKNGNHTVAFTFTMPDGKVYTDQIAIDFGGIHALKIALNNQYKIKIPSKIKEAASYSVYGRAKEFKGKIKEYTFGKYKFESPTVVFGDRRTSKLEPNNLGVIGLPLFMKFNITFDYFNNKLYLKPNKNLKKK